MQLSENLHAVESKKSVTRFIEDFSVEVATNDFVINTMSSMIDEAK
jgi:hypothetical protein